MYRILKDDGFLTVEFLNDFDYPVLQTAIRHETMLGEYEHTNDIWLIGPHRAEVCLGEIDLMVREFECRCPRDATRTKTAIVVDEGMTGSIVELWAHGLQKRVAFEIRLFRTLHAAKRWLGLAETCMA